MTYSIRAIIGLLILFALAVYYTPAQAIHPINVVGPAGWMEMSTFHSRTIAYDPYRGYYYDCISPLCGTSSESLTPITIALQGFGQGGFGQAPPAKGAKPAPSSTPYVPAKNKWAIVFSDVKGFDCYVEGAKISWVRDNSEYGCGKPGQRALAKFVPGKKTSDVE